MINKENVIAAIELSKYCYDGIQDKSILENYEKTLQHEISEYKKKYGDTPNLILKRFFEQLQKEKNEDLKDYEVAEFHYHGRHVNPYIWSCLFKKYDDADSMFASYSPQLYILINKGEIRFGFDYGQYIKSDDRSVEYIKSSVGDGESIIKRVSNNDLLNFYNNVEARESIENARLLQIDSFEEFKVNWSESIHIIGALKIQNVESNVANLIKDNLLDLSQLFIAATNAKLPKYWCFNFYLEEPRVLEYGLENNLWAMQHTYPNQTKTIKFHWETAKMIKEGDWAIAYRKHNTYFAIGKLIRPRTKSFDQIDTVQRTIADGNHKFTSGFVKYEDTDVFYENISSDNGIDGEWGQRIDVDEWLLKNPEGVYVAGVFSAITHGIVQNSLFGINTDFFRKVKDELRRSYMNNPINQAKEILKDSRQIIFAGAPGTGKTYTAKEIVKDILQIKEGDQESAKYPNESEYGQYAIIVFHPSTSYEDIIQGIVVEPLGEKINYKVQDKILLKMATSALSNPKKNYYLIIDEINRGNLPAILGELIYGLEYRDEAVRLLHADYDKKSNSENNYTKDINLPKNLYIIGTMNTADRSIGHIDYAIRRRFVFFNLIPQASLIKNPQARILFDEVNRLFDKNKGFNSNDYDKNDVAIGHSYFMPRELEDHIDQQVDELASKFAFQVIPLLIEYVKDGVLSKNAAIKIEGFDSGEIQIGEFTEFYELYEFLKDTFFRTEK